MGDFNSNTPNARGMEWRPSAIRQYVLDSPGKGLLLRMKPGNVTPAAIDLLISKLAGSPGIGIEILRPAGGATSTDVPIDGLAGGSGLWDDSGPNPQSGAVVAGWQNQAGAAATVAELNDGSDATYHRNTAATPAGSPITEYFAGLALGGPAIFTKYRWIQVKSRLRSTSVVAYVEQVLRIGGTIYPGAPFLVYVGSTFADYMTTWYYNPATGLPWTHADADGFWNNVNQFGHRVQGVYSTTAPAGTIHAAALELPSSGTSDQRTQTFYATSIGSIGGTAPRWTERTLLNVPGGAVGAGWVYLHVFAWRTASASNSFQIPVLKMPAGLVEATGPAATTGEHRKVYETQIGPGGELLSASPTSGEIMAFLMDQGAGVISSQSQPYAEISTLNIYSGSPVNMGTEITTAAITTYGGIRIPIGWQTAGQQPDAPLTIELRHGAGFLTGGGTLDTTMTVNPTDLVSPGALQDLLVKFPAALALLGATQYGLRIFSTATNGRGWKVGRLDTRSDVLSAGVSAADVQGATQGGTADSFWTAGTEDDRSELAAVLLAAPTPPTGLVATPVAAL